MNHVGSGGIGAVSAGISESVVWLLIALAVALLAFGIWKLVKLLWMVSG